MNKGVGLIVSLRIKNEQSSWARYFVEDKNEQRRVMISILSRHWLLVQPRRGGPARHGTGAGAFESVKWIGLRVAGVCGPLGFVMGLRYISKRVRQLQASSLK